MAPSSLSESRCRTSNKWNTAREQHNCKQVSMFRQSNQNLRVIDLIYTHGNCSYEVQEGRMNVISHESVLQVLEHHASQYQCTEKLSGFDDNLVSWALDATGMVNSSLLLNGTEANEQAMLVELQKKGWVEELGILNEVLKIHGVAPASKGEGIISMMYENANGISNRLSDNKKFKKATEIHDELEVIIAAYCKHWLNMRDRHNINGYNKLFKGSKAAVQSVVAHIIHKNTGRVQEGGMSLLLFRVLTEQLAHDQSTKDKTGFG
jgi:hypothetical protein